jgi:hypothetical protein
LPAKSILGKITLARNTQYKSQMILPTSNSHKENAYFIKNLYI